MLALKLHVRLRKIASLIMILTVIQAGLLGSSAPVLAQSDMTLPDAVYQGSNLPSEVAQDVYGGGKPEPNLPPALSFLREKPMDPFSAPSGTFTVSGLVYENSTGMPMNGVNVKLLINGHPTQFKTSTDDQGSYAINGVGMGQYLLSVQNPGYAPEAFGINIIDSDVTQDCYLFRNTSFRGRVVNERGDPLEGVQVSLTDQNLSDRGFQFSTNVDGWFNLVDVPPGRYELSVSQAVYHKKRIIWVDEYPQELEMVLRGTQPVPVSVPDAVYGDIPADPVEGGSSNEQPSVNQDVYSDSPTSGSGTSDGGQAAASRQSSYAVQRGQNFGYRDIGGYPLPKGTKYPLPNGKWALEFLALKEHAPLNELEKLLKEQATID